MTTELSIEKFSPAKADLEFLAQDARAALSLDLTDKKQLENFKGHKKDLQQARIDITRTAKSMREEALAFQKEVIKQEKEYLSIITPIEDELDKKMDTFKQAAIREERLKELPARREMLAEISTSASDITDDELLDMDQDAFMAYMNAKKAEEFERMQAEQRAREAEERRQAEIKEAEERAAQKAKDDALKEKENARIKTLVNMGMYPDMEAKSYIKDDFNVSFLEIKLDDDSEWTSKIIKIEAEIQRRKAREEADRKEREAKEALEAERRRAEDAERKLKEDEERKESERKAEEERVAREKAEEEEHQRKLAESKKWNDFLDQIGYDEASGNWRIEEDDKVARVYKLVDTFTFE